MLSFRKLGATLPIFNSKLWFTHSLSRSIISERSSLAQLKSGCCSSRGRRGPWERPSTRRLASRCAWHITSSPLRLSSVSTSAPPPRPRPSRPLARECRRRPKRAASGVHVLRPRVQRFRFRSLSFRFLSFRRVLSQHKVDYFTGEIITAAINLQHIRIHSNRIVTHNLL